MELYSVKGKRATWKCWKYNLGYERGNFKRLKVKINLTKARAITEGMGSKGQREKHKCLVGEEIPLCQTYLGVGRC